VCHWKAAIRNLKAPPLAVSQLIFIYLFFSILRGEVNGTGVKIPLNLYLISSVGLFMSFPAIAIVVVVVVISSSCKVALIDASGSQQFLLFRSIFSAQLFSAPFSLIAHCSRSSQTRSLKQRTGLSGHHFQEDKHLMRDK